MHQLPKLLLVEDDRSIAVALVEAMRNIYDVTVAGNGELALRKAASEQFNIIVLDLHLPDLSGMAICQQLRDGGSAVPILILSGENRILTKINLLDAGANDYLTKPFSLGEFKARLRALGRYEKAIVDRPAILQVSGIELNRNTFEVERDGVPVALRRKEFALLECLMERAGSVVTRDMLTRSAWGGNDELWTNTVDVHIKHLRDKLDRPFKSPLIMTVHGRGYKLQNSMQTASAL